MTKIATSSHYLVLEPTDYASIFSGCTPVVLVNFITLKNRACENCKTIYKKIS